MSTPSSISQAQAAAATGNPKAAMAILREVLKQNPRDVDAWLALADIVENPAQAQQCLERVLQIDPNNQIAQKKLLGEQLNELDFLFETIDEPGPEPEDREPSIPELDFSNLYIQANQPSQSSSVQTPPQDTATPSVPPLVPGIDVSGQQTPPRQRTAKEKSNQKKKKGLSKFEIVLVSIIGILCLCVGFSGIVAIGRNGLPEPEPTSLPEEVTAVIYENIRASNAKDFDGYMATIHSGSPVYNITKRGVEEAFSDEFTLSYRVSDVYIIEQSRNKAIVHFVLTTRLVSGPVNFRDNRVTGEMELRTEDGAWKIYNQEVISVDYLD